LRVKQRILLVSNAQIVSYELKQKLIWYSLHTQHAEKYGQKDIILLFQSPR